MKNLKLILFIIGIFSFFNLFSQDFRTPASVAYDSYRGNYIVAYGNLGSKTHNYIGTLVSYNPETKNQKLLLSKGIQFPQNMVIENNTVFLTEKDGIKAFNLKTMKLVWSDPLVAVGLTSDGKGNIYLLDHKAMAIKVMNANTKQLKTIHEGTIKESIAMTYNNGKLYMVGLKGKYNLPTPVYTMDLETKELKKVHEIIDDNNISGIGVDKCGNIYITTTFKGAIYKYKNDFSHYTVLESKRKSPIRPFTYGNKVLIPERNTQNVLSFEIPDCNDQSDFDSYVVPLSPNATTGAIDYEKSILKWKYSPVAKYYEVQYSTKFKFDSDIITKKIDSGATTYKVVTDNGGYYYWRVRQFDGENFGKWSQIHPMVVKKKPVQTNSYVRYSKKKKKKKKKR